ncbi:repeatdomain containing protein [Pyrenophora tritici-repentis]|nr:repeatdomain containing protein [Pyrenophora tritici-repentis]KAI1577303.1 repeatdomain containing protein [Pyrenophora tritici-repentis]
MAGPPSYPANTNFNAHHPSPPSTSSHSNIPFTPSATSVADSSDNELELTPVHSPGGPQYDDLPPSYDEAQHQAVHDTRNGIAPIDPNQIEAHRITSNEGPDEAEVWEYRVKGEQTDPASEREQAPDYANYRNDKATSSDLAAVMLSQALEFTRSEPNADAQYAPHLNRPIAIPENREPGQSSNEHKQFLCAYAEVLRGHSVRPAEFADFLYGLNVLATATNATAQDLLDDFSDKGAPSRIVQDYIRGANEAFFAPRGLTVSFRSEPVLLDSLPIPAGRRAAILADFLEVTRGAEWRAKQLYPWIEALHANVDGITTPSERVLRLHETGVRYASQRTQSDPPSHNDDDDYPVEKLHIYHSEEDEDPPHSIPGPSEETRHGSGHRHWSPFGMPGHGPFGAPGRGPFGPPGNGSFGPGRGPFGRRGRGYAGCRGPAGPFQQTDPWRGNEWAEVGKELGKIGEQFGKSMGNWGIEFGKRANSWGLDVGKMASGSGSQQRGAPGPAYEQVHDDLPPSYDSPPGQQSGVFHGDRKVDPDSSTSTAEKGKNAIFATRLRTINAEATAATRKGKKSASEISRERALAIEKAETEKENTDLKIASRISKRAATRDLKQRRRELKRQHKQKKRELPTPQNSPSSMTTINPKKEFVQIDELDIGLERSQITSQGQIELPERRSTSSSSDFDGVQPDTQSSTHQLLNKVKRKKRHATIKIREALHIAKPADDAKKLEPEALVLADTAAVGESNSRLDDKSTAPEKHGVKDVLRYPIDTVKKMGWSRGNQELADNIAVSEMPHGQEVDLVQAATTASQAQTEEGKQQAKETLSEMLRQRQNTYVRWSLDRHVTKLRVLPRNTIKLKPRSDFTTTDSQGTTTIDWKNYTTHLLDYYAHQYGGQYIGSSSSPPIPSKETIMPNLERLIVATSPFQEFLMTTRRVYLWQHPRETAKYLVIYSTLWYLDLLLPGVLSAILYLVAQRRWHTQTMHDLRDDIQHRENTHRTALSLTEFIEKRGNTNWAHDLLQEIGPWLMIQLADLANFFETVRNFYEWRKPLRTFSVLVMLALGILATVLVPLGVLVKTATAMGGVAFFGLFPVGVNFQEYRLLVSPVKRLLWNVPTHAEWAVRFVQAEGVRVLVDWEQEQRRCEQDEQKESATSTKPDTRDFASYPAHFQKTAGCLIISAMGIRFQTTHSPHVVLFALPYDKLCNLEKQNRHVEKVAKILKAYEKDLRLVDEEDCGV